MRVPWPHRFAGSKPLLSFLGLSGVALVGALDFLTGYQINLSFFYLAPIALCTWTGAWRIGTLIALASGLVAMLADVLMDKATAHEIFSYWNAANRLAVFMLTVFMVERIRSLHAEQGQLVENLNKALAEVKQLSGLFPMCAWCKKIRAEPGYWQQVEEYLIEHSEASFTHGICPECETRMREAVRPGVS